MLIDEKLAPRLPPAWHNSEAEFTNRVPTVSLFSGCGGLDFGAEAAGAKILFANDIDPDTCQTLRKYFPETDVAAGSVSQIRTFPPADLVIGGYPCQSFSMGGNRDPANDHRTNLFLEFARCVDQINPKYFVAENVSGLQKLRNGSFLQEQVNTYLSVGRCGGYRVFPHVVDARSYGVAQARKRLFIVGVRADLGKSFVFPTETHGKPTKRGPTLQPFTSHGEVIKDLPIWPAGEFYERPHDPEGHFSWYYMSRNRKALWDSPSYTIVANWRHITLHPASPVMTLTWSNLADGWKQRWDFSSEYEHLASDSRRSVLEIPRRLSWRECARIQTFPDQFEPIGNTESKFRQIGNAVPPLLGKVIIQHLISGRGLIDSREFPLEQDVHQLEIQC